MPRQRMIKPEFFDSDSLAECSIPARLTFIGLWVMGDDYGNQKANISKLKRNIYPCDEMPDSEFASHLIELERVGCIKGYQTDGDVFINVPNFEVYQTVKRPSKPRIPQPSERVKKAKRTKVLEQWINSGGIVGEDSPTSGEHVGEEWDTHPLLTHYSPTTHPQKKEGGTTYLLKKGLGGTGAAEAAPPAQKCNEEQFAVTSDGAAACLESVRAER